MDIASRTVGRPCSTCTGERDAIESAILDGESLSSISARLGITRQSLRRHRAHHMAVDGETASALGLDGVAIVVRVQDVAERARMLADDALNSGNNAAAVRAGDAELRALAALAAMRVRHEETIVQADAYRAVAHAVIRASRADPQVGDAIAAQLDLVDRKGIASDIREQFHPSRQAKEIPA